jgi:hypothetical protein
MGPSLPTRRQQRLADWREIEPQIRYSLDAAEGFWRDRFWLADPMLPT